ncbi:hypothetical protein [Kitasatospora sp. NPDC008115]|uniref:hypothetical protein n=1 Tax=Kitasatospora sp. NPDC008115 TaxID=3364022 RepID=UPI0036EEE534
MSTVERIGVRVCTVPTDSPEADGTLAWDRTILVLVEAVSGRHTGTGWTYGAPAVGAVVHEELAALVSGRDAHDTAGAHEAMNRAVRDTGRPGLALADQGVTCFEEPVSSDDLAGPRLVRDAVRPGVTAGESGYDPEEHPP